MSELIEKAFLALGCAASFREVELVAEALRNSGDEATIAALERASDLDEAFDQIADLALACGSSGVDALDLVTEFSNPGVHARLGLSPRD